MLSIFPTYRPAFEFQITVTEGDKTFTLPLTNTDPGHNFTVNWGDGSSNTITAYDDADRIHNYSSAGTYNIQIRGLCAGFAFNNGGDKLKINKVFSWGRVGFRRLDFYGCTNLTNIPNEKGRLTLIVDLSNLFHDTGITIIPSGIFDNNIVAIDFYSVFEGCSGITSIPKDLFKTNTAAQSFGYVFRFCTGIIKIPIDLFRYNTLVTLFYGTFQGCTGITSVPTDLFRYNTAVTSFSFCFFDCTNLISIPTDLFRYNILNTSFAYCFSSAKLNSVPTNLFKYNTAVTSFYFTFYGCTKLQQNANIFYADGEQSTRFLNQTINFSQCFARNSFSGIQGIAPDLWNCDFGTGTPTKTDCWNDAGNSLTSLSNYNDIPVEWI